MINSQGSEIGAAKGLALKAGLHVRRKHKHKCKHKHEVVYTCDKHKHKGDIRRRSEQISWRQSFKSKMAYTEEIMLSDEEMLLLVPLLQEGEYKGRSNKREAKKGLGEGSLS